MTQIELDSKAIIAEDLYKEGKITKPECFRIEVDAALGEFSGHLKFQDNTDFIDLENDKKESN